MRSLDKNVNRDVKDRCNEGKNYRSFIKQSISSFYKYLLPVTQGVHVLGKRCQISQEGSCR